jgi:aryl-alcohol dehydrogenase-like predicted oxidoreductase
MDLSQNATTLTLWDGRTIPRLGFGGWPIAGPFYDGTVQLGYARIEVADAIALVRRAADLGIAFFDTAAVYGAGQSERLIGQALGNRQDVVVATKFGPVFDEQTKQVTGLDLSPAGIVQQLDKSLLRLGRERIDLYQLHVNSATIETALGVFDTLDGLVAAGKIGAYGWSTDFPASIDAVAERENFVAAQHAMNLFFDAPSMTASVDRHGLISICRSPLAMGVLGGEIGKTAELPADDIRRNNFSWMQYYNDGKVVPSFAAKLDRIRDLLTVGGRTVAQGALAWLWAKSPRTLPIPGMRSTRHLDNAIDALPLGPLPDDVMAEIEAAIQREPEGEPRER